MGSRRAASLLEMVFASGILAVVVPLLLNLLPGGLLSLRRAEQLQTATSLALCRVDQAAFLPGPSRRDPVEEVQLGSSTYRIQREFYRLDEQRYDVAVSCGSNGIAPVVLRTRYSATER